MVSNPFARFFRKKWELVYSTQEVQTYAEITGRLRNHGIRVKTESFSGGGGQGGGYGFATTYHIYVPAEAVHQAHSVIHHAGP
ncbi:hypothetical protein ACI7RC_20030 [Brevibacillus sp. B_LB10_24]|uniref:hypothetical protein n=1 Tax=Brevibacillus sp. B_LB10_24 TaxID=3380645 RepID=UPI0038BB46E5